MNTLTIGGQLRTPKLSLEGGGGRSPPPSCHQLTQRGGGTPSSDIVTTFALFLILRLPSVSQSNIHYKSLFPGVFLKNNYLCICKKMENQVLYSQGQFGLLDPAHSGSELRGSSDSFQFCAQHTQVLRDRAGEMLDIKCYTSTTTTRIL